jgi:hypothetical protein
MSRGELGAAVSRRSRAGPTRPRAATAVPHERVADRHDAPLFFEQAAGLRVDGREPDAASVGRGPLGHRTAPSEFGGPPGRRGSERRRRRQANRPNRRRHEPWAAAWPAGHLRRISGLRAHAPASLPSAMPAAHATQACEDPANRLSHGLAVGHAKNPAHMNHAGSLQEPQQPEIHRHHAEHDQRNVQLRRTPRTCGRRRIDERFRRFTGVAEIDSAAPRPGGRGAVCRNFETELPCVSFV